MRLRPRSRPAPRPPLAAMSDIAFQLIIFFMVTASFVTKDALKIELPASESDTRVQSDEMVTVQANAAVTLLDGQEVAVAELEGLLEPKLAARPEGERIVVLLTADDLPFQKNVELMAAVQRAGGQVAIMMEEAE